MVTSFHHRRRSSNSVSPLRLVTAEQQSATARETWGQGSTSGLPAGQSVRPITHLTSIPGTPASPLPSPMSLSRSPSPLPGGGWSSPGLTPASAGSSSPRYATAGGSLSPGGGISWSAAKAKSDEVRSYPSFSTRNTGFFSRQKHKISASLPRFSLSRDNYEEEKVNRGRASWRTRDNTFKEHLVSLMKNIMHRRRFKLLFSLIVGFILYLNFWSCK